jgi:hypothetical protein
VDATTLAMDDAKLDAFVEQLPTVTIGGPIPRFYYLAEGDLLLTKDQVKASIRARAPVDGGPKTDAGPELKVDLRNGQPNIWRKGERRLTYAVDRAAFATVDQYNAVVGNMTAATSAWMNVCPACDVKFEHVSQLDAAPDINQLTFIVTFLPGETRFIAAAFFPYEEAARRYLFIAPSYYSTTFDKVGVLRHELGHVIGYRHEHIEGIPGCGTEDSNWKPLSKYDPKSVMHYFCGGGGTTTLQLSDVDKKSHTAIYH